MTILLHGYTAKLQSCQKNFNLVATLKKFDEMLILVCCGVRKIWEW